MTNLLDAHYEPGTILSILYVIIFNLDNNLMMD